MDYFGNDIETDTLHSGETEVLEIENGYDAVLIQGSALITKDRAGLEILKAAIFRLKEIEAVLEGQELPDKVDLKDKQDHKFIDNPFS